MLIVHLQGVQQIQLHNAVPIILLLVQAVVLHKTRIARIIVVEQQQLEPVPVLLNPEGHIKHLLNKRVHQVPIMNAPEHRLRVRKVLINDQLPAELPHILVLLRQADLLRHHHHVVHDPIVLQAPHPVAPIIEAVHITGVVPDQVVLTQGVPHQEAAPVTHVQAVRVAEAVAQVLLPGVQVVHRGHLQVQEDKIASKFH